MLGNEMVCGLQTPGGLKWGYKLQEFFHSLGRRFGRENEKCETRSSTL